MENYDLHGNYIEDIKINKFIAHKNYIAVNLQSLEYKTKKISLNVNVLKYYKKKRE